MDSGAKKSIHAIERDTEINRRRREAFVTELRTVPSEHLIYLDESGVSTQMTDCMDDCRGDDGSPMPCQAVTGRSSRSLVR